MPTDVRLEKMTFGASVVPVSVLASTGPNAPPPPPELLPPPPGPA